MTQKELQDRAEGVHELMFAMLAPACDDMSSDEFDDCVGRLVERIKAMKPGEQLEAVFQQFLGDELFARVQRESARVTTPITTTTTTKKE